MLKSRKGLLIILLALGLSWLGQSPIFIDYFLNTENIPHPAAVELTQSRIEHILYGNETGGGHLYGTGIPCKSEFPQDWDSGDIIRTVEKIAANDNLKWRRELNGYYAAEEKVDGIKVRVILSEDKTRVITGYPINVKRNPCNNGIPDAVNDNMRGIDFNE